MDELTRTSRFARRFALATTICCCATSGYGDQPFGPSPQTQALGTFLSQGWTEVKTLEPTEKDSFQTLGERPAIVRPTSKLLGAADSVLAPSEPGTQVSSPEFVPTPAATSLAELIKQRTRILRAAEQPGTSKTITAEVAPSVKRLAVESQIAANLARTRKAASDARVRAADPMQADPVEAESAVAAAPPVPLRAFPKETEKAVEAALPPLVPVQMSPDFETARVETRPVARVETLVAKPSEVADQIALPPMEPIESELAKITPPESVLVETTAPAESVLVETDVRAESVLVETDVRAESVLVETDTLAQSLIMETEKPSRSLIVESDASLNLDAAKTDEPVNTGDSELTPTAVSDRSRRIANNSGFDLLPLATFEPESATKLEVSAVGPSPTATIHATRLREIAQEALRNSEHRLQCRATHSAKKYATEALRAVVSMRDAEAGGNRHAKQLDVAFDAIRESKDFCGRFGVIDQNALKRMVGVHETDVLKELDLEQISALEATEAYLAVARSNLVLAAGGVREASDALVLLGQIEKEMSQRGDTHAAAVAVTLQRAAIEIEPTNAMGYRELGATLLHQGLVEQAAWALNRSIQIQPTRVGYQRLLEASRRLGDVDTARVCLASLENPHLQSEIPLQELSPEAFAATHRPLSESMEPIKANSRSRETQNSKSDKPRISMRSLLPFGRR